MPPQSPGPHLDVIFLYHLERMRNHETGTWPTFCLVRWKYLFQDVWDSLTGSIYGAGNNVINRDQAHILHNSTSTYISIECRVIYHETTFNPVNLANSISENVCRLCGTRSGLCIFY
jgi:hypothetical protein